VREEGARLDMRTSGKRIEHKACAQGHQGSGVDTVGRSEGTARRASRVGAAVGVLSHRSDKVGKPRRGGREEEPGRGGERERKRAACAARDGGVCRHRRQVASSEVADLANRPQAPVYRRDR
jgi:hypothetical protein